MPIYDLKVVVEYYYEVEAEDEDDARTIVEENTDVNSYAFDVTDESVEVTDIDENY